ncbi:response regulator transcription factor [Mucilaginibacter sp. HMF5004]|uniref:response regulator n=1 Tax=Mucilaginibacter rivuli TaxID=2857527 RepID=UPI001C5D90C3|nr:response regulator transcription factor [Mucilaginibacter rivuli]MBW4889816.1 response regulator transcription factor [Mucilaginibacter rivuli]
MSTTKRIILADDDPGILDAIRILLEFEGYQVTCVAAGEKLLTLETDLPHLILLDIWMSGIDGRDICRQLKQKENTRKLPIILISASKDIENSAIAAGADDFVSKPFEMDHLIAKIEQYIL